MISLIFIIIIIYFFISKGEYKHELSLELQCDIAFFSVPDCAATICATFD